MPVLVHDKLVAGGGPCSLSPTLDCLALVTGGGVLLVVRWLTWQRVLSLSLPPAFAPPAAVASLVWSPDGKHLVVGFGFGKRVKGKGQTKEGAYVVFSAGDMKIVHEGKDSNEPIRVVKFSPDASILAIGSMIFHFDLSAVLLLAPYLEFL
jgi:WD40 repeat protein